jgi:REP element-mobilizing transposase RayT
MKLFGAGFIVTEEEAARLGYGQDPAVAEVIKPYRNGRDLMQTSRNVLVIDLFGLREDEVRSRYPAIYQWVYDRVKPERDVNRRASYRDKWWIHGEARANLRPALADLPRYIATVETAKHRVFVFLDQAILPDNKLVAIALDDAYCLGVLSSRIHVTWALAAGSRLGVGNDPVYVKTTCFEKFPFPAADAAQQARIRALAEQIDAHRKRQQSQHPDLTLTDMYNVLHMRAAHPNPDRQGGAGQGGAGQGGAGQGGAGQGGAGQGGAGQGGAGQGGAGQGGAGQGGAGQGGAGQGGAGQGGAGVGAQSSLTVAVLGESRSSYQTIPLAYFITFHTYGTWLPGDADGSVDRAHNVPGTPMLPPDPVREARARARMDQPEYIMDAPRRAIVLQTIQEVCQYRGWTLLAAHIRTNHVHVVVRADQPPEKVMTDFKAYASRKLNAGGFESPERKRWTRHGSTRYLWQPAHVAAAIRYVVDKQGQPMTVYEDRDHAVGAAPAPVSNVMKEASEAYVAASVQDLPVFVIEDMEESPNPDRQGGAGDTSGPSLTVGVRKERTIHEHALLTILRQLHDELDAAVAAAYGWPADLPGDAILQRLVDLNAQRAAEEAQGGIRWLRPAYQAPRAGLAAPVQEVLVEEEATTVAAPVATALSWPELMPAQAAAVRGVLARSGRPLSAAEVAAAFTGPAGKRSARVAELLETLAALGQAAVVEEGRYAAG